MTSDSGGTTVPTIPTPAPSAPALKLVTSTRKVRLQPDTSEVLTDLFELDMQPDGRVDCPGCGYDKAKVEANRLKCFGCGLSASGYDLLAWFLDLLHPDADMRFEAMDSETFKKVEAERERLAIEGVEPLKATRRKVNLKAVKVARDVWADLPDKLDRRERNWMENERGIDPEAVEREGLVRTLRPTVALPPDLEKLRRTHSATFCLVDHNGDIGALRLRCPEESAVKAGVVRKTMNQRGAGVSGLVLANRTGIAWLKGKTEAERLVFAEGEMDFTVWAIRRPDLPVFGITKGGWNRDFGDKVKPGTTVIARTDNDDDGDDLALALVATLDPAVECYRLQPDPKGAERDDAERHRLGELDDDPMVGCVRVEVELNLELNKSGKPYQTRSNVLTIMKDHPELRGTFWHNVFDGHMYWRDARMADGEVIDLTIEMGAAVGTNFAVKTTKEALSYVARRHRRHPVAEHLEALVWDGTPRLLRLFPDYLHTTDDQLHRVLGLFWAVGAVARPMKPGCKLDNVLILVGKQGAGKSTFVETMAVNEAWTNDTPVDLTSKDARIALMGTWMMEYAELDSLIRSKLSTAKAFLTDRVDRYRPVWASSDEDFPRSTVFVCTTNERLILKDPTGNRRFWPVVVDDIDIEALERDRDQLWAEAVHHYRKGTQWWPTKGLENALEVHRRSFLVPDFWEDLLAEWLDENGKTELTIPMVLEECFDIKAKDAARKSVETRLGHLLDHMGWVRGERARRNGSRARVWRRK